MRGIQHDEIRALTDGDALDPASERPRAAGFAHYLLKPVDPARLLALMAAFGADAGPAQRQSPDDSAMAPLN